MKYVAYGINHVNPRYNRNVSIHAENDLMLKMPYNNKRKKKINILVIHVMKNGVLKGSKPCMDCINKMSIFMMKKNYMIKNIYYSDNETKIVRTNLEELKKDKNSYVTLYKRYRERR